MKYGIKSLNQVKLQGKTKLNTGAISLNEAADPQIMLPSMSDFQTEDLATKIESAISPTSPDLNAMTTIIHQFHAQDPKVKPPKPPIKYPVFQGGGAKGGAYVGAYEALEQHGCLDEIVCPGGASAGGIPAFFMGLGFDSAQFKYLSENINFRDFTDLKKNGWGEFLWGTKVGVAMDVVRYGAASPGQSFHHWASYFVEQVLGDKTATFRDLHEKIKTDPSLKDMLFTGTRYATKGGKHAQHVFSYETTPDVLIADAFRATIGFPTAFEPWEVREKQYECEMNTDGTALKDEQGKPKMLCDNEGKPKYTFKSLGFFADGGILNNLPIHSYNNQYYADPRYPAIERRDQHQNPVQVNPSVVGFSLTSLEDLDETITPLPKSIKEMQSKSKKKPATQSTDEQATSWHYLDLIKAGFWNVIGKPETENVADKHKMYFDQTVQIWPANVSTLEFDISKEKLSNIITNGKNATELWLRKNRNPNDSYLDKKHYDDRLSPKEEKLRNKKPEVFYYIKLKSLYSEFITEVRKQEGQGINSEQLLDNIRLRYLSSQIEKFQDAADKAQVNVAKQAFTHACKETERRIALIRKNRQERWNIISPESILKKIEAELDNNPESALQILQSQLGAIVSLVKLKQGTLLNTIVKKNNAPFTEKVLQSILNALQQGYYQSKISDPEKELALILNTTSPSLLAIAIADNNIDMVKLLMKHGANIMQVNSNGKNALEEAISLSNYTAFKEMILSCVNNELPLSQFKMGKDLILHSILKTAPDAFLVQLYEDKNMFISMMNSEIDSKGKNILHLLAEKGTAEAFCAVAYTALTSSSFPKTLFTNKDFSGKSLLACLLKHQRSDIFKEMIYQGKGKNNGYFLTGDYHFDQIFNLKYPCDATIGNYQDLIQAFLHNPKLYRFIMNNFSDSAKSDKIHEVVSRNASFKLHEQPKPETIEINIIDNEPVLFRRIFQKEHDNAVCEKDDITQAKRSIFGLAA